MKRISLSVFIFIVAMIACVSAQVTPAGENLPLQGKFIAYVTPGASQGGSSFMSMAIANVETVCREMSQKYGFEFTVVTCTEASQQNNVIEDLIHQDVDMILLWPITGEDVRSGAEAALAADVQLIVFGRLIYGLGVPLVAGNNIGIGQTMAEYFNTYFTDELAAGERVDILEFIGGADTASSERSQGFADKKAPNMNVIQQLNTAWERGKAMSQMENILNGMPEEELKSIRAIYTHDEEIALGVLDAIRLYSGDTQLNIKLVSGVGDNVSIRNAVRSDKEALGIDVVFCGYPPVGPANVLVSYALPMLLGERKYEEGKYDYFPVVVIDKDDLDDYAAGELDFLLRQE